MADGKWQAFDPVRVSGPELTQTRAERDRYRKALVEALHALDPDAALMPQVYDAVQLLEDGI